MKKTIALILAIIMMAALAVPAFAVTPDAGITTETINAPADKPCTVSYGVNESYTVSLPTAISFGYSTETGVEDQVATLSVENFVIDGNNKLVITMDSAYETTPAGGWAMRATNGSAPVPYTVTLGNKVGENVTATAGAVTNATVAGAVKATTIMEVASNKEGLGGSIDLTFETTGTQQAGDYSDTITFGVSIVAK